MVVTIRQRGSRVLDPPVPQDVVVPDRLALAARDSANSSLEAVVSTLEDPTQRTPPTRQRSARVEKIQGRSLSQIAWRRLRKDKFALAGGAFIVFLVVVAIVRAADHQDHRRAAEPTTTPTWST